jgi:hypothetical protein
VVVVAAAVQGFELEPSCHRLELDHYLLRVVELQRGHPLHNY